VSKRLETRAVWVKLQGPELVKAQCCELDAESSEGVQLGMRGTRNKNPTRVFEFQFQPFVLHYKQMRQQGGMESQLPAMPQRLGAELIIRCALTRLRPSQSIASHDPPAQERKKRSAAGTMSPVPGQGGQSGAGAGTLAPPPPR
jgi:hypothetical protein